MAEKCGYKNDADEKVCPNCLTKGQPSVPFKRTSCYCATCNFECEVVECDAGLISNMASKLDSGEPVPKQGYGSNIKYNRRNGPDDYEASR